MKYEYSEQVGNVIYMISENENKTPVREIDVLNFIVLNRLNYGDVWVENTSPFNDGDPRFDVFEERELDTVKDYLDGNFEHVMKMYYKKLIKSN